MLDRALLLGLLVAMPVVSSCSAPESIPEDDLSGVDRPLPEEPPGGGGARRPGGSSTGGTTGNPAAGQGGSTGGGGQASGGAVMGIAGQPGGAPGPGEPAPSPESVAGAPDGGAADGGVRPRDAAAPSTAPGLGAPPACASGKTLICEDFEKAVAGAVPAGWSRQGSATTITQEPARGMLALQTKSAVNATYSVNRISRKITIPGTHWGRVYYKVAVPSPRPASGVIHATFVALGGTMPTGGSAEYRIVDTVVAAFNNKFQYLYNVQPNGREFGKGSSYNWAYDGKWQCTEWYLDEATQTYRLYLNGSETPALQINNGAGNYNGSQIPKSFSSIWLGVAHYQNSVTGFTVSFDELAIDSKRIGCN
jgi:hypothetical protein